MVRTNYYMTERLCALRGTAVQSTPNSSPSPESFCQRHSVSLSTIAFLVVSVKTCICLNVLFFFPPLTKYCVIECFLLCSSVTWKTVVALPAFSESPVLLWAAQGAGCLPGDCSRSAAQDRLELCRLNQALLSEASEC